MRPFVISPLLALVALATPALAADPLRDQAKELFQSIPTEPPTLPGNAATPAKLDLGRMLYFEPRLSQSHNISCNTCHLVGMGGADGRPTSLGHNWQLGGRNAPTVFNAVFNTAQFWDGRAADLEAAGGWADRQPGRDGHHQGARGRPAEGHPGLCRRIQGGLPRRCRPDHLCQHRGRHRGVRGHVDHARRPFDRWLAGDDCALDAAQKQGLSTFIEKGCSNCHNGINIGGGMYAPFGVVQKPGWEFLPPADRGRFQVTKTVEDDYVFKVPTLRNIELTAPYFHSGHAWDLKQAVAVMGQSQLGEDLTEPEIDQVTAFLRALTGEQPRVEFPILPPSVATTPRPEP